MRRADGAQVFVRPIWRLCGHRQALEGIAVAPGNAATLSALTDPSRRPLGQKDALPINEVAVAENDKHEEHPPEV